MHPKHICDTLVQERITGFAGVPTIWVQLLQRYSPFKQLSFPDLRYITNSGDTVPLRYLKQLREILTETRIYLMYGLTEAFRSTYLPPEELEKRPTSIGKAIPNVDIHVLNERGEECGPGEPGELVHRGANIFQGYWNDTEATAKVLKPFPFGPEEVPCKEMAVYSGDIVTRDEEGFLYFIGRKDHLIKSAGYRISPQEIEDILHQMSGVKAAAVLGVKDDLLGHKIKAFVSRGDHANLGEKEVIDFCAERLPNYMVPHTIVFLDDLPRTLNEKVDRVALKRG
jgi:acyl-CoA synthetase (AMP-forming)/AMP-acid ligase II